MKNDLHSSIEKISKLNTTFQNLLNTETGALSGNLSERAQSILTTHNKYNELLRKEQQGMNTSKDPGFSTYDYIVQSLSGSQPNNNKKLKTSDKKIIKQQSKRRMENIFNSGDSQISSYFLSDSSELLHLYDEIDSVCAYFYQLDEAISIIRDNVLRAEQVNEDLSVNINFPGVTDDTSSYVSVVKKALNYQNLAGKIRDHVVPSACKYGKYSILIIPYSEIGTKLQQLRQASGSYGAFYGESTIPVFSDDATVSSCMESVESLYNIITESSAEKEIDIPKPAMNIIEENLKSIYVCEDKEPPDIMGLSKFDNLDSIVNIMDDLISAKNEIDCIPSLNIHIENLNDTNAHPDQVFKRVTNPEKEIKSNKVTPITDQPNLKDILNTEDIPGCHIKLADPRELYPIKIFDFIVGYYYFENYNYTRTGTTITDLMQNQMNYDEGNILVDRIVDSVLSKLKYKDVVKGDDQFRNMILNCILYSERRRSPIRIKFVQPDYVKTWNINKDKDGNGQPVLAKSLIYARIWVSMALFYTSAIITKSTDSEFYYLKESALGDAQTNNRISDLMDQLESSNIDPIEIANGNLLHGNRAINKRFFTSYGTTEVKPIEIDVVSGQNINVDSEFLNMYKKMAIGTTSVPAVMVDYVDEIEYATMLGSANIKHLTRCNSIKKDCDPVITDTVKTIIRHVFPNAIPDNILDKLEITLRQNKVINNNTSNQQLNDNIGLAENMVKTWLGTNYVQPTDDMNYIMDDMVKTLVMELTPSCPWELLPNSYQKAIIHSKQNQLKTKIDEVTDQN